MGLRRKQWDKMYNLAKEYYKHHGNLKIKRDFKTNNGYEYDKSGDNLGIWIINQRSIYNGTNTGELTNYQIELLNDIEMIWSIYEEKWDKMYNLAKEYYKHHGNLNIKLRFKTKNGYEYDKDGDNLGKWISYQRSIYNGTKSGELPNYQINLLDDIEMIWCAHEEKWEKMYKLAKEYYKHHGNLNIKYDFKTKNGYEYDKSGDNLGIWISNQRSSYKGTKPDELTNYRIKLLEKIEMIWFSANVDNKLQREEITKINYLKKKREILSRFNSLIIGMSSNMNFNSSDDIIKLNKKFIQQLDYGKK